MQKIFLELQIIRKRKKGEDGNGNIIKYTKLSYYENNDKKENGIEIIINKGVITYISISNISK